MRLLDLYCGAGACSVGYYRAGFDDITGVDIVAQPHYPFRFVQSDALEFLVGHGHEYDLIHASPPCQAYTQARFLKNVRQDHPDLIAATREALQLVGKPYVIENVPGAPLRNPLVLCGSMFGLGVLRHRLFEIEPPIYFVPMTCKHGPVLPMFWGARRRALQEGRQYDYITVAGRSFLVEEARQAMGIDWMTREEIKQAIPPAYTEWIGRELMAVIGERVRA